MEKLDRVLDGQDVFVTVSIDLVDYCRQRGRFARACGASNQDQASGLFAKVLNHLRQTQVVKRFDLVGNRTEDGTHRAALIEDVGTKARKAFYAKRKIELQVF